MRPLTKLALLGLVSLCTNLDVYAQVKTSKPQTKPALAVEGSGEGRNGPDLDGVANPKGADQLLKRDRVFNNACNCLVDLYSDLYQQITGNEFKDDYPNEKLNCSLREMDLTESWGIDTPSLADGVQPIRGMEIGLLSQNDRIRISRTVNHESENTYYESKTRFEFPKIDDSFKINYFPLLTYEAKIDHLEKDSLGRIKNVSYSVSNLQIHEMSQKENTKLLNSYSPDSLELSWSTYSPYTFETDVVVNIKKYRRCLLNIK